MSRVPNPSCTTAGHENEPAIGIVRLADTGTEHPYCGECIDTLRSGGVDTVVRMWVPDEWPPTAEWPRDLLPHPEKFDETAMRRLIAHVWGEDSGQVAVFDALVLQRDDMKRLWDAAVQHHIANHPSCSSRNPAGRGISIAPGWSRTGRKS